MIDLIDFFKDIITNLYDLGFAAYGYCIMIIMLILGIIITDYSGYAAKMARGSKRVINFIENKGWVDNSNINSFLKKCIRFYPYSVRASFFLFTSSNKQLTDYINERCFNSRDYSVRERIIKYIYDFTVLAGAVVSFLYLQHHSSFFDALITVINVVTFAIIARYIIIVLLLYREVRAKKLFTKAVDIMANGIFIADKRDSSSNKLDEAEDFKAENCITDEIYECNDTITENKPDLSKVVIGKTH